MSGPYDSIADCDGPYYGLADHLYWGSDTNINGNGEIDRCRHSPQEEFDNYFGKLDPRTKLNFYMLGEFCKNPASFMRITRPTWTSFTRQSLVTGL